ncbi:MAG: molybdopterin-dependent oxidoreductase [Candidatus Hydrogenedentes bacterium]|nr:molybdopterin-dependent oxidoreductase [Candidatus Hydrogenedentota bacterium]
MSNAVATPDLKPTACILCSVNCGLLVEVADGHFVKIRGDKAHPTSAGYQCQKALRLDYYQNGPHRLTKPLRRRDDGTFEEVSWETAIAEVAAKFMAIRDTHGGHSIAQYGGGGQGNHLGGAYAGALRAALGTRYVYSALAQEKTGGFWINGKLFGTQQALPGSDHHHADFILAIGWNPWQSHGIPQARKVLQDIAKDPNRTLVVIDPRRTETAEKADTHMQVRPGGDAHLMLAMLGIIVQEGLHDQTFLAERCVGFEELRSILVDIPIDEYCTAADVDAELVRSVTRQFAAAKGAVVHTDLGLEHSLHSTLNLYLSKLLWLLTGNLGKKGAQIFFATFVPLIGNSKEPEDGGLTTKVTGMKEISKLFPPNVLPKEIDSDHPDRLRALFVDSGNPVMTVADGAAVRKAFEKLELLVVIDVAMTETARMAHYVFPASSQYEKWEATFFNFAFPENFFHLRAPLFEPEGDTLAEPEIYRRLLVAMGAIPESFPELEEAARAHVADPSQGLFPAALMATLQAHPEWSKYMSVVLYSTLGKALPDGAASAAILWGASQRFVERYPDAVARAGIVDEGAGVGEALFKRILQGRSGTVVSKLDYDDTWSFITHPDARVHLAIPELIAEIEALREEETDTAYPFVLQAGERRSYNANQIFRRGDWRKNDRDGALKIHPADALRIGLEDGDHAEVRSRSGAIEVSVVLSDEMREGLVSLPHGYGMLETAEGQEANEAVGPDINLLTSAEYCDAIAKTPFHKHIPVNVVPALVPAK